MSCGDGCGCCPKCGCRATCTCNHSMGFEGDTFSYSVAVAMMEPDSDSGTVQCGPYCGNTDGNGADIGYVHGMSMRTAKRTG